ncbi:MAG: hypothetical protein K2P80_14990 [Beijerinckiaceae bacterium]|nr:hypothetical protein [Beijerinckiaceae bacterium]
MADPSIFDALRIPADILVMLDNRPYHFAMQRWHYVIRLAHIVSMAMFFGGIVMLDLQMVGLRTRLPLDDMVDEFVPALYWSFGVAIVTGTALFFYDPVHVGAHAYFTPKLVLTLLGLVNARLYHWLGYERLRLADGALPLHTRIAGWTSLAIWTGVMACAALNVEGVPKVYLR